MTLVKKTAEYKITKRNDGRHAVVSAAGAQINGEEKTKILLAEGLIKLSVAQEKPAEEPAAEETTEEATDAA
jgi:hypothetical protein